MSDKKEKYWWAIMLLGTLPGIALWIILARMNISGEFLSALMAFGAYGALKLVGVKIDKKIAMLGSLINAFLALFINHLTYTIDIYLAFQNDWYVANGVSFSFLTAFRKVFTLFVLKNYGDMRTFYLTAAATAVGFALLVFIACCLYEMAEPNNKKELKNAKN